MRYGYCSVQKKVVPVDQIQRETKALDLYIQDEMPPTRHPVTGEVFTSKAKFREVTRALGFEEVGNDYDNGYEPERKLERETQAFRQKFKQHLIENYNRIRDYER